MDSKEFGLVAAQQVLQLQDLHYGFWEKREIPSIKNFFEAQNKYTLFLLKYIEEAINTDKKCKILDIGCGVGITTKKLLEIGYRVDGLVPSSWMAQQARKNTKLYKDKANGEIYECNLEDFPTSYLSEKYSLAFFSESFQYVNMHKTFNILNLILTKSGTVIIFDFFKRDEATGKSPIGGGHSINKFYEIVEKNGYAIHTDLDVTEHLSPNISLANEILVNRILPFSITLDAFLSTRYKLLYKLLKYIFKRKLEKMKSKYSSNRNEENFKKFKTYRLLVLKRT